MAIPERTILEDVLVAPCQPEGEVDTLDQETKDGECYCSKFRCLVDSRNIVIQKTPIEKEELQTIEYT